MAFLKEKNEERKLDDIPSEQLNDFLGEFIITVKRKDRDEFEPSSLRGFLFSFSSQLKACKYPKNIMEDLDFEQTRKALEARSRQLEKTSMFPSASPFSGAVFHGGQFNITINAVNKSPGTCASG